MAADNTNRQQELEGQLSFFTNVKPETYVPMKGPFFFYKSEASDSGTKYPCDPHQIVFGDEMKPYGHSGSIIESMYRFPGIETPVPFLIQTPIMTCPFGLGNNKSFNDGSGKSGGDSFKIKLSFSDAPDNPDVAAFHHLCVALDHHNIATMYKCRSKWFTDPEDVDMKSLERDYTWLSKLGKSKKTGKKYPPSIGIKLPFKFGRFDVTVFDDKMMPIQDVMKAIVPGTRLRCLFRHKGLWFGNRMITNSNMALQIQVFPSDTPQAFCLAN
jgi:hypothetical protein